MLPPGDISQAPHVRAVKLLCESVEASYKDLIRASTLLSSHATFPFLIGMLTSCTETRKVTAIKISVSVNAHKHAHITLPSLVLVHQSKWLFWELGLMELFVMPTKDISMCAHWM